ncbi:hypothetical protein HanPI659440_Chr09g0331061 [Helianthus annuus]|nr:hypothetical protein HanPI659440_Chr09g0331061 [Helianthus annuus]
MVQERILEHYKTEPFPFTLFPICNLKFPLTQRLLFRLQSSFHVYRPFPSPAHRSNKSMTPTAAPHSKHQRFRCRGTDLQVLNRHGSTRRNGC